MITISDSLNKIVIDAIGKYEIIKSLRESSKRTSVYFVSANQNKYYIKLFKRRARFEPEVFAYTYWNKAISKHTPNLVAIIDDGSDEFGLIMTELEGTILRETELSKEDEYLNYQKAGELSRVLQDSTKGRYFGRPSINGEPIEEYYTDATVFLKESLKEIEEGLKSTDKLNKRESDLLEWANDRIHLFENEIPVPVSWDSTPGNWLTDKTKKFSGFIDFENMRWGIRCDTFGILYERYFLDDMRREQAYFEGYGKDFLENNQEKILFILIKMGLADIYYGTEFENDRSLTLGNRLLKWIETRLSSSNTTSLNTTSA